MQELRKEIRKMDVCNVIELQINFSNIRKQISLYNSKVLTLIEDNK